MKAENKEDAPVITPVSGVGDEAFYLDMAKTMSLIVKKGSGAFKIVIYGGLPTPRRVRVRKRLSRCKSSPKCDETRDGVIVSLRRACPE